MILMVQEDFQFSKYDFCVLRVHVLALIQYLSNIKPSVLSGFEFGMVLSS